MIPLEVKHGHFAPRSPAGGTRSPDFLHRSQRKPRKNMARLAAAYGSFPKTDRPRLVVELVGDSDPMKMLGAEFIDRILGEAEIADPYSGALTFVFPSLHEDFGLPVLEPIAGGCPVITSRGTACAEVAGDAALLVDPRSVTDIASALATLAGYPARQRVLLQQGPVRAADFNRDLAADRHAKMFQEDLETSS